MAGSHVKCNPIQPGIKRAGVLERLQLQKCLHKGVLNHVSGVLGVAEGVKNGVVQPVLILQHQLAKRIRLPGEGLLNQLCVVVHSKLTELRRAGSARSSRVEKNALFIIPIWGAVVKPPG